MHDTGRTFLRQQLGLGCRWRVSECRFEGELKRLELRLEQVPGEHLKPRHKMRTTPHRNRPKNRSKMWLISAPLGPVLRWGGRGTAQEFSEPADETRRARI